MSGYIAFLSFYFALSPFINLSGLTQLRALKNAFVTPMFATEASLAGNEIGFSLKSPCLEISGGVFYPVGYIGGCELEMHTFVKLKDKFTGAGASICG